MGCRTARQWITMALAGEAPPRALRALERHLEGCEGCRRERTAYAGLDRALGLLPMEAAVPDALQAEVSRRIRQESTAAAPASAGFGWWIGVPALAGAAVLALAVRGTTMRTPAARPGDGAMRPLMAAGSPAPGAAADTSRLGGAATKRRRPAVPTEPPPELTARPDLFVDLPILRNLERLEHYDAIQTTTLEGQDEERSNG